jgi:hypothetical protein
LKSTLEVSKLLEAVSNETNPVLESMTIIAAMYADVCEWVVMQRVFLGFQFANDSVVVAFSLNWFLKMSRNIRHRTRIN